MPLEGEEKKLRHAKTACCQYTAQPPGVCKGEAITESAAGWVSTRVTANREAILQHNSQHVTTSHEALQQKRQAQNGRWVATHQCQQFTVAAKY